MLAVALGMGQRRAEPERATVVDQNVVIEHGRGFSQMNPAVGLSPAGLLFLGGMSDRVVMVVENGDQPAAAVCRQLYLLRAARSKGIVVLVKEDGASGAIAEGPKVKGLREFLLRCGYLPDNTTVLVGSVRGAGAEPTGRRMAEAMEQRFNNRPPSDQPGFLFVIEDIFSIKGRGVVVTGLVERGTLRAGDQLEILGDGKRTAVTCRAVESSVPQMEIARQGDCVGVLLDIDKRDVERGLILSKPGLLSLQQSSKGTISGASQWRRVGWERGYLRNGKDRC